jgi:hypothetical protein
VIRLDSPLSLPLLFCDRASLWGKQKVTRRLKAMQLAQPVRLSLRPFCVCDVLPGKQMRQAKVIER